MASACFVCSECGAVDLSEHVVLDRPCPECDAANEAMGLVQCAECLDPAVPGWAVDLRPAIATWVHAARKPECPDSMWGIPVVPLVGMEAVISLVSKDVYSGLFGRVAKVRPTARYQSVAIDRADGGRTNATLRPDGQWKISGHAKDAPGGSVIFFVRSRSTRR